jgi:hypothetical protein
MSSRRGTICSTSCYRAYDDFADRIREDIMLRKTLLSAATLVALGLGTTGAFADECSGRDHTGGTILGAIAGGVLGGAASHGNGGAVITTASRDPSAAAIPGRAAPTAVMS